MTTATTDGGALTAQCSYCTMGYGQTCAVSCSSAPDVVFALSLTWTGCGYCCELGGHDQDWRGCHCERGHAVCPNDRGLPGSFALPWSACEFCNRDAGPPIDASTSGG